MVSDEKSILQKALKIRRFEELVLEEYKKGKIFGTVHTCIGQEVFPVILNEFTPDYFWFSNHRGHGHYLSKTNDFDGLFAEIFNKEGGIARDLEGVNIYTMTNSCQMVFKVDKQVLQLGTLQIY